MSLAGPSGGGRAAYNVAAFLFCQFFAETKRFRWGRFLLEFLATPQIWVVVHSTGSARVVRPPFRPEFAAGRRRSLTIWPISNRSHCVPVSNQSILGQRT